MDLDLGDCFRRKKTLSNNQRNMVLVAHKLLTLYQQKNSSTDDFMFARKLMILSANNALNNWTLIVRFIDVLGKMLCLKFYMYSSNG